MRVGLTCGGPGDVLQAPDSQSAAALLDSFVTLYEATRDRVWIDRARAAAHLLAQLGDRVRRARGRAAGAAGRGVRATGAVFWSAGSGRGSPGYVLSSGDALLRLYRATGDVDAARAAARHRPQPGAVSAARRTSGKPRRRRRRDLLRARTTGRWLEPGDSVVPADGVFDAIGLLSYTEVPGIYVRPDTGFVFVFDHVTARIKERGRGRLVLAIANPTERRGDGPHPVGDGRGRRRAAAARGRAGCADGGRAGGRRRFR